jgi:hypothetical protein
MILIDILFRIFDKGKVASFVLSQEIFEKFLERFRFDIICGYIKPHVGVLFHGF